MNKSLAAFTSLAALALLNVGIAALPEKTQSATAVTGDLASCVEAGQAYADVVDDANSIKAIAPAPSQWRQGSNDFVALTSRANSIDADACIGIAPSFEKAVSELTSAFTLQVSGLRESADGLDARDGALMQSGATTLERASDAMNRAQGYIDDAIDELQVPTS